ncbi:MAG: hypothetical protein K0T00_1959 [Gaiellaceae bacterium]|nr:hypothetical protein [Gaiellaceae bacterium]
MHSRVTMLEIDTLRIDVDDAAALFDRDVLPTLQEEVDYAGAIVLATPEGKGLILTLWDSETAAADESGFATGELERFAALFRSPPGREYYRVVSLDLPHVVV